MNRTFCAYFIIVGILVAVSTNVFGQTTEQDVLERLLKVEQEQLGLIRAIQFSGEGQQCPVRKLQQ